MSVLPLCSVALVIGLGLILAARIPLPGVTIRNALRLRRGMSRKQVEAIFGCGATDEAKIGAQSQLVWWADPFFAVYVQLAPTGTLQAAAVYDEGRFVVLDLEASMWLTLCPWLRL